MKEILPTTALMLALMSVTALAIDVESTGANKYTINGMTGFRLKSMPHYNVYYQKRAPSSTLLMAFEKTWKEAATLLPNLDLMFKTGDLDAEVERGDDGNVAPAAKKTLRSTLLKGVRSAKKEDIAKPFKTTLVFVDNKGDYQKLALSLHRPDLPEHLMERARISVASVSSYTVDGSVRIYWAQNPHLKQLNFAKVHLSHGAACDLIRLHQKGDCPFWLDAGFGYFMEFKLYKKSATLYLDYQNYYDEYYKDKAVGGDMRKTETFELGRPWAPVIKRIMRKKGREGEVDTVLAAATANLNPERCGYVYAFLAFLASSTKSRERFNNLMLHLQDNGADAAAELLPKVYGYDDTAAMQTAWHKFMKSAQFR